jgi:nitrogen fixation NifU-like protein
MYSPQVLDHFERPRNAGELDHPNASAQVENPACGDILKLSLQIDQGRITEARVLAKGCVPAMACGSAITELATNQTLENAVAITPANLVTALHGLPAASGHAAQLAVDTLRKALAAFKHS